MISERSAIVTLGEANDLAERFDAADVGVIVDAYHVFWDPRLEDELAYLWDNADAVAELMEAMRILQAAYPRPRRTIPDCCGSPVGSARRRRR